ncbi:unnamed protein product [Clonostachys solani]|uniref:Arrestin-like N-terminal domain-containing protein n=1 Tax=Clonostachys solani TaxID=160281 RepID=A0A9P0ER67_9HYPO|nr:unnamed protein product [Clonostachys solani]
MAPTPRKSYPALGIELEGQGTAFYPGDTIIGKIHRRAPIVSAEARIDLAFHGRTKSKMVVKRGDNRHTYRGRFTLLHQTQSVFAGPVHIPEGNPNQQEWPFALQIPQNIDARLFPQQYDAKQSFIPIDPAYVGDQPLPASFYSGWGSREGFIEYYIEATLRFQRKGSWDEMTATMPIHILAFNPNPPIVDFHLQCIARPGSVCTQRLVPGMENAELSKTEKMKKFFGTKSVPAFFFKLDVSVPSVIQLGHYPIPVLMRLTPNWPNTSEIIRNVQQKPNLISFKATLESWCDIRCDGYFRAHETDWKEKLDLQSEAYGGRRVTVEIPCSDKASRIDVGKALNLRIGGHTGTSSAFHDFTTFNVSLSHQLSWTAKCEIAGEDWTIHGSQPVKVLPQTSDGRPGGFTQSQSATAQMAESWMVPPAEVEPPPTFAEVERDDKKQRNAKTSGEGVGSSSRSGQGNLDDFGYPKEKR